MNEIELGPVAKLLVSLFPEMWQHIQEMRERDMGIDSDLGIDTGELSAYELYSLFREDLLEPVLADLPRAKEKLQVCCEFLLQAESIDRNEDGYYRSALYIRVVDRLSQVQIRALVDFDPRLRELLIWQPHF